MANLIQGANTTAPELPHSIEIRDEAGGKGKKVTTKEVKAGETFQVWAAGYDGADNYIGDVEVVWAGTGVVAGRLSPDRGKTTTFTAQEAGDGSIHAAKAGVSADPGAISVKPADVDGIEMTLESLLNRLQSRAGLAFGGGWGILSLALALSTLFLLNGSVYDYFDALLRDIASIEVARPIIILCTFVAHFFVASMRSDIHRGDQTRQFKEKPGRSVSTWALTFFIVAILFIFVLTSVWSTQGSIIAPRGTERNELHGKILAGGTWHMVLMSLMTGVLLFIPVMLTLAASMMAVYEYGQRLNREGHLPIYMDTEQLREKVLEAVRKQFDLPEAPMVSELKRLENGGISLTVQHRKEPAKQDGITVIEERTWLVEADALGRINKIEEKPPRLLEVKAQS